MGSPLRILLVEDMHDDAVLVMRAVRAHFGEVEFRRADSEASIVYELRTFHPHIALADHNLPLLPGGEALNVLLRKAPGISVIIVTGSLGEELASEYIKSGAAEFVLKDHLRRLGPAVTRALELSSAREQHRRAEEQLRAEQQRQRAFFSASPLPMWVVDRDTLELLDVNDAAIEHYGFSREEFVRLTLRDLLLTEDTAHLERVRSSELPGPHRVGVRKHVKKDGSVIEVDVVATDLTIDGRELRIAVVNDVTEQRRIAAEMENSQRMEAIGRLAGGVAHDFNNLLTVIQAASDFILAELSPGAPAQADIELIVGASREATALTRQLLAFGRRQVMAPRVLDLNALIPETQKMLGRLLGTRIVVRAQLSADLGRVRVDASQVQQILVNLAVNARDAMPDGGTITIETYNAVSETMPRDAQARIAPAGVVVLRVSDTGVGMDAATQARIFEPFFTTKERGRGTGLGLATVYGIVQQSGGNIVVESAPGKGSAFAVHFPRVIAPLEPLRATEDSTPLPGGVETILVAEDDEMVRSLVDRILRGQGYQVIVTANGAEAQEAAAKHSGSIDLLVTDVVMPGINGYELARALRTDRPAIAVLLMSGYVEDDAIRTGVIDSGELLLEKPFGPPELTRAVRTALDSRTGNRSHG